VSRRVVEATAPTRVDLAGGTLDLWPLYLFHPGSITVNVAIDRRAWCRVETGVAGVRVHSKDTLRKAEGRSVADLLEAGELTLVAHVLRALGVETGVHVTTQSRVPAGSGLGGSSALAVALTAAVARAVEREVTPEAIAALARDAEARCIEVPTGSQDHFAAIHGGVLGIHLEPGSPRIERLRTDPARVEESLLLVDAGIPRSSGINNWAVFKAQIDGDATVRGALGRIASASARVRLALVEGRYADVGPLLSEEWEARKGLAAGVTTPEIERIVAAARSAGGAAKVCGAGGGGIVAVWAPPAVREAVRTALAGDGFRPAPVRVDLRGLEVE
jgi:D-glycero-alpha-D-manno-heptose-7-phosphate kinase